MSKGWTGYQEHRAVRDGYAAWIGGYEWTAMATQTYKRERRDALNCMIGWWSALERKGWTRAFVAAEKHRLGGVHLHALLYDELQDYQQPLDFYRWQQLKCARTQAWMSQYIGWSFVTPICNTYTTAMYCSKYVTKDDGDYMMFGNFGEKA
jgi:hypothetical protein